MSAPTDETLDRRALNRALLARQLLIERVPVPPAEAVEHLVGLQAQATLPPYYGLWSRLEHFDPRELGRLLVDREAVRLTLMRGTVHLVTARDALVLRPLLQPVIERVHKGSFGRRMGGANVGDLVAGVRELLGSEPMTARELGKRLVERGIGDDAEAIGNASRVYVPLVQVPPRGVWGRSGQAKYQPLEAWTCSELVRNPRVDEIVLRYLRGFGPASVADAQSWSGLTRLRDVFERLRSGLLSFRDGRGTELFDLPEAPRPGGDVEAPVRFLGEYDNVLLGHADRSRIIPDDFPWQAMLAPGRFVNNLLVDGTLRATWWIEREGARSAKLAIRPFRGFSRAERDAVVSEASEMLDFAANEVPRREVRFEPAVG